MKKKEWDGFCCHAVPRAAGFWRRARRAAVAVLYCTISISNIAGCHIFMNPVVVNPAKLMYLLTIFVFVAGLFKCLFLQ